MSNILVRTITGAVFITLVLFPLFWKAEAAIAVFGLFTTLGLIEFYKMFNQHEQINVRWEIGLFLGLFFFGSITGVCMNWLPPAILLFLLPLTFIASAAELWRKKAQPLLNIAALWLGILYVVLPFTVMVWLQSLKLPGFPLLAGMFILIWMNDTFAYLSGRFFGKTKLIERISPNKTWEGTVGGIVFTVLGALALGFLFDPDRILFWALSALIIAPCAIFGDLLESLFKRNMGVKDSGALLPGHGGVLDRFDATLFAVPFFVTWTFFYLYL